MFYIDTFVYSWEGFKLTFFFLKLKNIIQKSVYLIYLLTFTFCGLWTASVHEKSTVRGRELLSGREGK